MPHAIIDLEETVEIEPPGIVRGYSLKRKDAGQKSIPLASLRESKVIISQGRRSFSGNGRAFADTRLKRIENTLEANGAYLDGENRKCHARQNRKMSSNIIQPYPESSNEGVFPTIEILPQEGINITNFRIRI